MDKVACYIRVSTDEQKLHGISLDAQRDKLTEYANKHQLKIVGWYCDEGVSGRKLIKNRPELQHMIKDAQAGLFDRILFIKLDRFFRSVAEYHECMKKIQPVVWTATEEKYDLTTANGRAFVNMKLTIAELEADQTGERIRIVNDYKVKTGKPLSGALSMGFMIIGNKDKRIVKNPVYAPAVTDLINHYMTHNSKRLAYRYVKDKYPDINISYRMVTTQLKDSKLCGMYRGNTDYCEAYIDKETFDKLQSMLAKNIRRPDSGRVYLYTGLISCPLCGRVMSSNTSTQYGDYRTYKCNNHYMNLSCGFTKTISQVKIEKYLLKSFDQYVTKHITEAKIIDQKVETDNGQILKRIEAIKKEMKNTTTAFTKDRLTEAEYDRAYEKLETELKTLSEALQGVNKRDLSKYDKIISSDWKELYNALNDVNKRAFWRKYIKSIEIDKNADIIGITFFD